MTSTLPKARRKKRPSTLCREHSPLMHAIDDSLEILPVVTEPKSPGLAIVNKHLDEETSSSALTESLSTFEESATAPNSEKAQTAPFRLQDLTEQAVENQRLAIKNECYATVFYFRAGLELRQLKAVLKTLRRSDFVEYTKAAGITPSFRKRAMQIAKHFETEDSCQYIPLLEALRMAKKKSMAAPVTDDHVLLRDHSAARIRDTSTAATATTAATADTSATPTRSETRADAATPGTARLRDPQTDEYSPLTQCEIDAGTALLVTVNGNYERAVHVIKVLTEAGAKPTP